MGVDVELHAMMPARPRNWELSRATLLAEIGDEEDILSDMISSLDPEAYPVLGGVDPYGDTFLDADGALAALAEIGRLKVSRPALPTPVIDGLERILQHCVQRPGAVVEFIGD
ncbi:hypothetical protein OHV13_33720 [Kitasatospora purpeofusca]|uniref:hypothetical protein n=1 Tax=Kitasatospora purpeofusca TaxID=67352 RepID=UPI003250BE23